MHNWESPLILTLFCKYSETNRCVFQHTFCGGDARLTIVSSNSNILIIPTASVLIQLSLTALISSCSNNGFGGNWYSSAMMMTVFGISGLLSLGWNTCVLIRFKLPICSVYSALSIGVLHGSLVVAYTNLAQENHQFYQKNHIFWKFGPLVRSEETNIFENFLWFLITYH